MSKSTVKHAAIGMGAGFLGNAANQTISKGAGNYDMVEGITSSVAGAAGFMTAGMFLPAAPTGNQAVAKAAASLGKRVLSAGATGFKIGAATGLASDVSVQTAKILGGEQKRFDPFSTGLSTLAGGAVGAGVAAGAEVLANSNAGKTLLKAGQNNKGNESSDKAESIVLSFKEALKKLEYSGLKPGQAVISKSRVMQIVDSYSPIEAYSSVYVDSTGRYIVDGHHTTVATTMLGKGSSYNMNIPTTQPPSATDVHWTKHWYEFWKTAIKVVD